MYEKLTLAELKRGILAISPIAVFLVLYLVTSIVIGDFYKMPISIALLIASLWAAISLKGRPLHKRIEIFSKGASGANVIYMIWIFILAGVFAYIARYTGAVEATVDITLHALPSFLIIPGLFIITCFISMSIGTSVGTVVALTPIAVEIASNTNSSIPYFVAIVLGGAFFGDNLSFISDTTIAATRTQGCNMKDKFFANLRIVLPAALIALALYCIMAPEISFNLEQKGKNFILILPYLIVIGSAIAGINVVIVLLIGIVSASIVGLLEGKDILQLAFVGGEGVDSVGGLIIITLLAAGMLGIIKETGGIDFILRLLGNNIKSSRGAQLTIAFLVGLVNLCTANNTVAILTVGSVAKDIAGKFAIDPKRSASILDTASCITQALIPYGAQSLMAASLAGISPVASWQYLYYPQILIVVLFVSIFVKKRIRF